MKKRVDLFVLSVVIVGILLAILTADYTSVKISGNVAKTESANGLIVCEDSDEGINKYVKGKIVKTVNGIVEIEKEDSCKGKMLSEYYCGVGGNYKVSLKYCAEACVDGTCGSVISKWKLDEGVGDIAKDSISKKDGVLLYGPKWVSGKLNKALDFDGIDDYVEVSSPFYEFGKEMSVEMWINARGLDAGDGIAQGTPNIDNEDNNVWGLMALNDKIFIFFVNDNGIRRITPASSTIEYNKWHHIAGVVNETAISIYVDGKLSSENSEGIIRVIFNNPKSKIHIGKDVRYNTETDARRFFNGLIDDVTVYNRALTASEIKEHYEQGIASSSLSTSSASAGGAAKPSGSTLNPYYKIRSFFIGE